MNTRRNKVLIGLIFVLTGVLALTNNALGSNIGALTLLGAGVALLLLYKMKRKSWSLAAGCYMLLFGALYAANRWLGPTEAFTLIIIAGVFFLAPGVIFIVLYYDKNKRGLLVPACILIWVGLFVLAFGIPSFRGVSLAGSFICAGFAFITMRVLGRHFLGKLFTFAGVGLLAVGVAVLFGFPPKVEFLRGAKSYLPGAFIVAGLLIIAKAVLHKDR